MKIRNGFVSNSSSSSFVIRISDITKDQFDLLQLHKVFAGDDAWDIQIYYGSIMGNSSSMIYDMREYMKTIKIPDDRIMWSG
ncbi:hypothetical protein LCGC14_2811090 [marine sediment metagenome]|uniref:Uncharacterized protein n=1 Tax=marine sediment metagenome TaxID=412755 RepID=A0A0F8YJT1_9ZZZZ